MVFLDNLPNSIKFRIVLFLINPDLIKKSNKKTWCLKCGELVANNFTCASNKCLNCCYLYCVNAGNFYINPVKSKPFRFDDDILTHL